MDNALRYDKTLSWLKIDRTVLEINDEVAVKHKKELVIVVVAVPVILALHYAKANN